MNSRETILQSVRNAIADLKPRPQEPPAPNVWAVEHLPVDDLVQPFQTALVAAEGEFILCRDMNEVKEKTYALLHSAAAQKIGVLDRPLSREIAEAHAQVFQMCFPPDNPDAVRSEELARYDAAIVSPEYLLADTGSCFFAVPSAFDRLLTYIAPLCVVIASKSMLRENLSHLWEEVQPRFGSEDSLQSRRNEAQTTGEFVIMTGPSRTADIEKVLILGVHGPKRVVVFLF